VLAWVVVATVVYGTITLVLSIFSRPAARYVAKLWCVHLLRLSGARVKVEGAEKLSGGRRYVFVCNHQSAFDIPVLYAGLPNQLSFIAKKELFLLPFFGWGIAAIGHIWVDRGNARKARLSIKRGVSKLKREHTSLVVFPEGTRSLDGTVGPFKKGSFTLALESGVEVVPVAVRGTRELLPKGSLTVRPGTAFVYIADPLDVETVRSLDKASLSDRVRAVICGMLESRTV
jgi:1-acyl-sn-glycerol-3-phosphate acyltransferase